MPVRSGETLHKHFQHTYPSIFHHLGNLRFFIFHFSLSLPYIYIITYFLQKIKKRTILRGFRNFYGISRTWRRKTKNGDSRFKNRPLWGFDSLKRLPPFCYLKSFRISSNAMSMAVFRLFYMIRIISASRMDCFFFFFFSLSFWLWLIGEFSPR